MKLMKHPDHGFHHAYNKAEEDTLRKNGWVDDVPAVISPETAPEMEPESTPDRVTLLETAAALGVKIDGRWSTARIAEEVAKG
jgi:hypothetical protein